MGSDIKINDTLQISIEQGFPEELKIEKYIDGSLDVSDFIGAEYQFSNKSGVRLYKVPPVRNFLVQNVKGKWIYWGLVHILNLSIDYVNQSTSGQFRIIYINSLEQMREAHQIIDRNKETQYFN